MFMLVVIKNSKGQETMKRPMRMGKKKLLEEKEKNIREKSRRRKNKMNTAGKGGLGNHPKCKMNENSI